MKITRSCIECGDEYVVSQYDHDDGFCSDYCADDYDAAYETDDVKVEDDCE